MNERRAIGERVDVFVSEPSDVDWARQRARDLARREGFSEKKAVALATAVSEIARNIVVHAGRGELCFRRLIDGERRGIVVVAHDQGPGIADIALAMQDGYSTKGSLGLGLSGAQRLVDEFQIESAPGRGVTIRLTQWDKDDPADD